MSIDSILNQANPECHRKAYEADFSDSGCVLYLWPLHDPIVVDWSETLWNW